jgi:rhodanese-related sulfurtransferase
MIKRLKSVNLICLIAVILLSAVFSGCNSKSTEANKASFSNITPEEAKKSLDTEKDIILLDVRTKEEYETGHIKQSMLIPVDTLKTEAEKQLKDKEAKIFVYCRSGNRSVTAANILVSLGYKNVYNLGGISNWPYEIVK